MPIFILAPLFWFLIYIWEIQQTIYFSFFTILFNNITIKSSNINVIITGYLFQDINIHQWRINIQHFMLGHPLLNIILNDTYKQEIFPTFRLPYGVHINLLLNIVKVKEIANIKFHISTRKHCSTINYLQGRLSTFLLAPLLIFNSFGSWCTYGRYNQHYMLDISVLYSTISW